MPTGILGTSDLAATTNTTLYSSGKHFFCSDCINLQ